VLVGGAVVSGKSRNERARLRRRSIGYVFQDFNLLAGLTATENVALPLELDGMAARTARTAALAALADLGLADRAARFPDELSGGERQRVAIARAVVGERRLLLADEPSGALDSVNADAVMRLIRTACQGAVAGVVVTHDAQLASWADREAGCCSLARWPSAGSPSSVGARRSRCGSRCATWPAINPGPVRRLPRSASPWALRPPSPSEPPRPRPPLPSPRPGATSRQTSSSSTSPPTPTQLSAAAAPFPWTPRPRSTRCRTASTLSPPRFMPGPSSLSTAPWTPQPPSLSRAQVGPGRQTVALVKATHVTIKGGRA